MVSSCLVGMITRYDGASRVSQECLSFLKEDYWIPFCPEQLGGLPTPRPAAEIAGGNGYDVLQGRAQVIDRKGSVITSRFIRGARQTLYLAESQNIQSVLLKSESPSCGIRIPGVTAALLMENGISVREFSF